MSRCKSVAADPALYYYLASAQEQSAGPPPTIPLMHAACARLSRLITWTILDCHLLLILRVGVEVCIIHEEGVQLYFILSLRQTRPTLDR